MKGYAIESEWPPGFSIIALANSKEEAEAKLKELKTNDRMVLRITEEDIPDDPEERFEFVTRRLIEECCCIDNESPDNLMLHISWGGWKHEHIRADRVMELYGFELVSTDIDDENGSDCYSAWRTYIFKEIRRKKWKRNQ